MYKLRLIISKLWNIFLYRERDQISYANHGDLYTRSDSLPRSRPKFISIVWADRVASAWMDSGKVITLSSAYTFFHQIFLQYLNTGYNLCMYLGYVISLDFIFHLKTIISPTKLIILLHVNIITLIIFKYWLPYLTILLFKILLSFIYHYINKELFTITFVGEIL